MATEINVGGKPLLDLRAMNRRDRRRILIQIKRRRPRPGETCFTPIPLCGNLFYLHPEGRRKR